MGHRKHSAPRRGSLAFRPRARHGSLIPRIRNWPEVTLEKPSLLGFMGFKAGTTHAIAIDDREKTPNFGKPLFNAASVISCPPLFVCGFRAYGRTPSGLQPMTELYSKDLPKRMERKVRIKLSPIEKAMGILEDNISEISKLSAIIAVHPKAAKLSQKKPLVFEVGIGGGGNVKDQLEFLQGLLSKEFKISEFLKPGDYVDVIGVSKGKGFEGPVTRFGVKRKQHKSRKSVRAVGVLGPWHPAAVTYTVPRAGQRGFHQRVEYNKRVLMVGNSDDSPIDRKGSYPHFGLVKGEYVVLKGSVPGPAKRAVLMRYPMRGLKQVQPKIQTISLGG